MYCGSDEISKQPPSSPSSIFLISLLSQSFLLKTSTKTLSFLSFFIPLSLLMTLQLIVSLLPPPAAVASGFRSRRQNASFNLVFSGDGSISASTKLSSLSSAFSPLQKDVVHSFKALELNLLNRGSVHSVAAKASEVASNDVMSTDTLELKLEPEPSDAKKSKEDGPKSSYGATKSKRGKNPKQLSSSAAVMKSLDHFQVLRYPLGTESAIKAMLECNTLVFVVDKLADKKIIKEAATNMFNIKVKKVNTSITADGIKKAYIMLQPEFKAPDVAKRIKIL